jgi:hypothetical protein
VAQEAALYVLLYLLTAHFTHVVAVARYFPGVHATVGEEVGAVDGYAVGYAVGYGVGYGVGYVVGDADGVAVG